MVISNPRKQRTNKHIYIIYIYILYIIYYIYLSITSWNLATWYNFWGGRAKEIPLLEDHHHHDIKQTSSKSPFLEELLMVPPWFSSVFPWIFPVSDVFFPWIFPEISTLFLWFSAWFSTTPVFRHTDPGFTCSQVSTAPGRVSRTHLGRHEV